MAKDKENKGAGEAKAQQKGEQAKAQNKAKKAKAEKKKAADEPAQAYKRTKPPRLKGLYDSEIKARLKEELGLKNIMQVPRLVKITLNMGLGAAVANPKLLETAVDEMRAISGQSPVVTTAKKDIATFKLRRGHKIGVMVTLRREWMWEFLDRFISVALPRVRDFRGVSPKAFDGRGNFSVGVREQIIFPEIDYDAIDAVKGMNVTIVTTAKTDAEGRALLKHLGMPFRQPAAAGVAQGAQV
jgi:large subunit ribosomal protein L5